MESDNLVSNCITVHGQWGCARGQGIQRANFLIDLLKELRTYNLYCHSFIYLEGLVKRMNRQLRDHIMLYA